MASLFLNPRGWDPSLLCPCCKCGTPWALPGVQHTSTHSAALGGLEWAWSLGAEWVKRKRLSQGLGNSDDRSNSSFVLWYFVYLRICLNTIKCGNLDCYLHYLYFTRYISHTHIYAAAAAAKSLQSCPTLCDPIGGSPPGFTVPGIIYIYVCCKYI